MGGPLFNVSVLTGNAGSVTLDNISNTIGKLGAFTTTGAFSLTDSEAITLTGVLSAGSIALTDSSGIAFNGGSTSTTDGQTYSGPVTLYADTTLTNTGANTAVEFLSELDSLNGGQGLTVTGNAQFDNYVGVEPLASLTVTGASTLNTGSGGPYIKTAGAQTYEGAVTLDADTTLYTITGGVTFNSKIDGDFGLAIYAGGTTTFAADVGDTTRLASLTVNGATAFDGVVTTTGDQTYTGAVTLNTDQTLTSTAGSIDFGSTVDAATAGGESLTVNAANGTVTFGGDVGAGKALELTHGDRQRDVAHRQHHHAEQPIARRDGHGQFEHGRRAHRECRQHHAPDRFGRHRAQRIGDREQQ